MFEKDFQNSEKLKKSFSYPAVDAGERNLKTQVISRFIRSG